MSARSLFAELFCDIYGIPSRRYRDVYWYRFRGLWWLHSDESSKLYRRATRPLLLNPHRRRCADLELRDRGLHWRGSDKTQNSSVSGSGRKPGITAKTIKPEPVKFISCNTATRGSIRAATSAEPAKSLQHLLGGGIFSMWRMGQTESPVVFMLFLLYIRLTPPTCTPLINVPRRSSGGYASVNLTVIADMDAGDIACTGILVAGGAKTIGVGGSFQTIFGFPEPS